MSWAMGATHPNMYLKMLSPQDTVCVMHVGGILLPRAVLLKPSGLSDHFELVIGPAVPAE